MESNLKKVENLGLLQSIHPNTPSEHILKNNIKNELFHNL